MSITGQLLFVVAAVMAPLIFTEHLSPLRWMKTYVAPIMQPPPPERIAESSPVQSHATLPSLQSRVFVAPTKIPAQVSMEPGPAALPDPGPGVPGGTGVPTAGGNLLGTLIRPKPPPPPKPAVAAKPLEAAPAGPVPQGGRVQEARILRRVIPVYPVMAKTARVSGTVRLVGVIAKDGTIRSLQVISGSPLLVRAAVEAVQQWVYRPTLLNGEPVEVIAPIDVVFTLTQ